MSEDTAEDSQSDPRADLQPPYEGDTEEVDALVVIDPAEPEPTTPLTPVRSMLPTGQVAITAAMAATGFLAGATVVGLAHRRHRRALAPRRPNRRSRGTQSGGAREIVQIVGSRSLLVDVHLLGGSGRKR